MEIRIPYLQDGNFKSIEELITTYTTKTVDLTNIGVAPYAVSVNIGDLTKTKDTISIEYYTSNSLITAFLAQLIHSSKNLGINTLENRIKNCSFISFIRKNKISDKLESLLDILIEGISEVKDANYNCVLNILEAINSNENLCGFRDSLAISLESKFQVPTKKEYTIDEYLNNKMSIEFSLYIKHMQFNVFDSDGSNLCVGCANVNKILLPLFNVNGCVDDIYEVSEYLNYDAIVEKIMKSIDIKEIKDLDSLWFNISLCTDFNSKWSIEDTINIIISKMVNIELADNSAYYNELFSSLLNQVKWRDYSDYKEIS